MRFSLSQVPIYNVAREHDPEVFERIQGLVERGQWENVAATWVEGDLNMAAGEAFARHVRYASEWSERYFGRPSGVLWEPDTFGHPGNMPQLANLAGCDVYFHWRCNPGGEDSYPVYYWEGVDGSRVLCVSSAYGGSLYPGSDRYFLMHNLSRYQAMGFKNAHFVWGSGNHGGGLARFQLEVFRRLQDRPLFPRFRFSTVQEFVDAVTEEDDRIPTFTGENEPLFEGCFTTQAEIKRQNRRCENALLSAETISALMEPYDRDRLREGWQGVLFNQFHDILDGAAVNEACADAEDRYDRALGLASDVIDEAVGAPSGSGVLTAINTLDFPRNEIVVTDRLSKGAVGLKGEGGFLLPIQHLDGEARLKLPVVPGFSSRSWEIADESPTRHAGRFRTVCDAGAPGIGAESERYCLHVVDSCAKDRQAAGPVVRDGRHGWGNCPDAA